MNPQDDSDDARVARRGFEFFVEGSDRILARRVESGEVLIEEEAVDVDHRDPRRMSPRGPGAKDAKRTEVKGESFPLSSSRPSRDIGLLDPTDVGCYTFR